MEKKQKIFIISICIILVISVILLIVYAITKDNTKSEDVSKLKNIYEKMMENETYSITFTLDDKNKYTVTRKGDKANIDNYDDGTHTTDIIKDGNTYLLMYSTKKYYTYQNNSIGLGELSNELNDILQSQEVEKGQEEVNGKKYSYEEYKGVSYFLMNLEGDFSEEDVNTRFYFDGNKLKYIKTIVEDKSELISVDMTYEVNDNVFEIPSEFEEG